MYTIDDNIKYELTVNNSKFITLLYKIDSKFNLDSFLSKIKNEYPNATHYCYAYIKENTKKASDDGEPSGTAGMPILKVLESNNLTDTLCVVVRYFGGIKLGANGLIRAYTKCASNAIRGTTLKELIDGINIDITFKYDELKNIEYILRDFKINHKTFKSLITYNLDIPKEFLDTIIKNNLTYSIICYHKIEK